MQSNTPPLSNAEIAVRGAALAKANTAPAPQPGTSATPAAALAAGAGVQPERPSVGRVVHFYDGSKHSIHPTTTPVGPFAAIITAIDARGAHLSVFKPAAPGSHEGFVKHKSQLGKNEPQRYWEWPPVVTG